MKITRLVAVAASAGLALIMGALPGNAWAAEPVDFGNLDAGSGVVVDVPAQVKNVAGVKDEALVKVIHWRRDALATNVKWPTPDSDTTVKQYLAKKGISETEYLQPHWSKDLEYISLYRAAETGLHGKFGHFRANDEYPLGVSHNGKKSRVEVVSWGVPTASSAIDLFASEKQDWVNNTPGKVTGHYTALINPDNKSYGFAGVTSQDFNYHDVWVGEGSNQVFPDQNGANISGAKEMPVRVAEKYLDFAHPKHNLGDMYEGDTVQPTMALKLKEDALGKRHFPGYMNTPGTWSTDTPKIAAVRAGKVVGVGVGQAHLRFRPEGADTDIPVDVEVKAVKVISVQMPTALTTASGTAPTLPRTVQTHLNNGKDRSAQVTWDGPADPDYYKHREGGDVTLTGHVKGWDQPIHLMVHVTPATVTAVSPQSTDVTTPSGTAPVLPKSVQVTWSNGDKVTTKVLWERVDRASYAARQGGTFSVSGQVEGVARMVKANVTVQPATVTKVQDPAQVTTPVRVRPDLPTTVTANWSNGDSTAEPVTWDRYDKAKYEKVGQFVVTGHTAHGDVRATIKVVEAVITQLYDPPQVVTPAGTAPVLPQTVKAKWSNGMVTQVGVSWSKPADPNYYRARRGNTVSLTGTVAGTTHTAAVMVKVQPATALKATIAQDLVKVPAAAHAPRLPSTASVTWSNGDVTDEAVTWTDLTAAKYQARQGGTFPVHGDVVGLHGAVTVRLQVAPALVQGVAQCRVSTLVGKSPKLPTMASVRWSNGQSLGSPVTWDRIGAQDYAHPGTFTVHGTVLENQQASCLISVVRSQPVRPGANAQSGNAPARGAGLASTGAEGAVPVLAALVLVGLAMTLGARRQVTVRR